jgi:hypothetical protein
MGNLLAILPYPAEKTAKQTGLIPDYPVREKRLNDQNCFFLLRLAKTPRLPFSGCYGCFSPPPAG